MPGQGKAGWCKICDSPLRDPINKLVAQGKNAAEALRIVQQIDPEFYFSRQVYYSHRDHVTHPLITHVKQSLANPTVAPRTTQGFLELVQQSASQRALDNPEEITVKDGLQAANILSRSKEHRDTLVVLLAKAMTHQLPEAIEGEYEVLPSEDEEPEEQEAYTHG